ncbi:MAG TPA: ABC transporter ATP-binding protein [Gemmatimonadaceae bacterium]|jgi:iron complex transport system ATP-binding protein|nr:ABC transporter ATP-binding protein [Gemmatimonadaceae bacterium]
MIAVTDLVVSYPGVRDNAVDGVTFVAERARLTALAGPNGSGKSSIVKALLRRADTPRGVATFDGRDVRTLTHNELARSLAVVPQREDAAFPMQVREYIALGRYPHLGLWRSPAREDELAVEEALHQAGVTDLALRDTDALSGGEWQRVRIARALAQKAPALVLDEPTTFLDVAHEMAIFELLYSLSRSGLAVLLVSHQLNLVARFADTIVLLDHGKVAIHGTPAEVMRADRLESIYDWPVVVSRDPAVGAPSLVPLRRPVRLPTPNPPHQP